MPGVALRELCAAVLAAAAFVLSGLQPNGCDMGGNAGYGFPERAAVQHKNFAQWQNYGQTLNLAPPWTRGQAKSLLRWQQASSEEPIVCTVLLALDLSAAAAINTNHTWQWQIQIGAGGAKRTFLIDAIGAQQISVPMSSCDVDLVSQSANISDAYVAPTYTVPAVAYVSTHGAYSRLATLTQWLTLQPNTNIKLAIPNGADAWKLLGIGDTTFASSPFVGSVASSFNVAVGASDEWLGFQLAALHAQEDHVPIPGAAKNITIANTDLVNAKTLAIQWSMDF